MKNTYLVVSVIFCLLISPFLVNAEVNETAGFEWLNNMMVNRNWGAGLTIEEISLAIMALRNEGYDVSGGVDLLLARRSPDGSWRGNLQDTTWATLALYKTGNDIESSLNWLQNKQIKAYSDGNWLIQILTGGSGNCLVEDAEGHEYGSFGVDGTTITGCPVNDRWIDVSSCVLGGPVGMYHSFNIHCGGFTPDNLLLLYKRGNDYYLLNDDTPGINPLELENACFGSNSCDCSMTGFSTWVLESRGKDFKTTNYLKTSCDNTALQNGLLYEITGNSYYADWLISPEHFQFGQYWGNYYDTAFIIGSLKQGGSYGSAVTSATNYLGNRQTVDGSWGGSIKNTAIILWRVFSTEAPIGGNGGYDCDYDGVCEYGETYTNCPTDCTNLNNQTQDNGTSSGPCNYDDLLNPGIGEECDATYDEITNELISGHVSNCADDQKCIDCTCQDSYTGPTVNNTLPGDDYPSTGCDVYDDCRVDNDCIGVCYYCDSYSCNCLWDEGCCEVDDDCDTYFEHCDTLTNTCQTTSSDPECEFDSDCSDGYTCENDYCVLDYDDDDSEDGGSLLWLWITIIIVVIVGGAGYFFYKKKGGGGFSLGGKGKKKQTFEQFLAGKRKQPGVAKQQPRQQAQKPYYPPVKKVREDKYEKELDESIKKAKDLLKK